jgi:hypothetical protein
VSTQVVDIPLFALFNVSRKVLQRINNSKSNNKRKVSEKREVLA